MKNLNASRSKKLKNVLRERGTDDAMRQIVANAKKLKEQIGVRNFGSSLVSPLINSDVTDNQVNHFDLFYMVWTINFTSLLLFSYLEWIRPRAANGVNVKELPEKHRTSCV